MSILRGRVSTETSETHLRKIPINMTVREQVRSQSVVQNPRRHPTRSLTITVWLYNLDRLYKLIKLPTIAVRRDPVSINISMSRDPATM